MLTYSKVFDCEWETIPFDQYFTLIPTNTFSREQLCNNGEIGNIHYGDILIKYGCVLSKDNYIPRLIDTSTLNTRHYLKKNDVIIADTAEDETVGKAVQVGDINIPLVSGLHTIACRPNYPTADGFLGYYINSRCYHDQILPYVTGIKVSSISKKTIGQTELHIPKDVKEQQAIASVLSVFDEHIANLTELIDKKKAIRDGALEDLVSGRTRLDGFDGEWVNIKLSDFAQINPSSSLPESFKYVDLESVKGISLVNWRVERKETAPSRAKRLAQHGDIFFQTVRPYQRNNYLFELPDKDFVFSTGYAQIRTENNAGFLFLLLRQDVFVNEVLDNCTGTSYPAINPSKLAGINIYVPVDICEQQAIASILSSMDEEVESLETEKTKIMQIREGAMDDLLTGRVRLKV